MSHTYTLQLHTGSFVHQMHTFDEIKEKAERIIKKLKISDIILGWNTDEKLNQQLVSYFHEKGIRVLLWLPVLSETDQLKNITMITTVNGTQGERVNVIEHEVFLFLVQELNKILIMSLAFMKSIFLIFLLMEYLLIKYASHLLQMDMKKVLAVFVNHVKRN